MTMYLQHFGLREPPFGLTPDTHFFFAGSSYQAALNTLLVAARSGEGFVKIVGEVGNGKTLLCRKFLAMLNQAPPVPSASDATPAPRFLTAYILNPYLEPRSLLLALAEEFSVPLDKDADQHQLLKGLTFALLECARNGQRALVCLDEVQAMPLESLEVLRLLTNLETEKSKLLQVVLFGQPELDERLSQPKLRQLKQRISFSYFLPLMNRDDLDVYLYHRLAVAGFRQTSLFTKKAKNLLFKASHGIPRLVNILAHKALLVAYGQGIHEIDHKIIRAAVQDTEAVQTFKKSPWLIINIVSFFILLLLFIMTLLIGALSS